MAVRKNVLVVKCLSYEVPQQPVRQVGELGVKQAGEVGVKSVRSTVTLSQTFGVASVLAAVVGDGREKSSRVRKTDKGG